MAASAFTVRWRLTRRGVGRLTAAGGQMEEMGVTFMIDYCAPGMMKATNGEISNNCIIRKVNTDHQREPIATANDQPA
jgi:hypothetical protein